MKTVDEKIRNYSFNEHRHRFAMWTAARAVQRSFTNTKNIIGVIEKTALREFAESNTLFSQADFDRQHAKWCELIISLFQKSGQECSYGRAAKLIAIYLKTSVVVPSIGQNSEIAELIHPPIDEVLLSTLIHEKGIVKLKNIKWTKIENETEYHEIRQAILDAGLPFNWKLEAFWNLKPQLSASPY